MSEENGRVGLHRRVEGAKPQNKNKAHSYANMINYYYNILMLQNSARSNEAEFIRNLIQLYLNELSKL